MPKSRVRKPIASVTEPIKYIDACHTCFAAVDTPDDQAQIICRRFPPTPILLSNGMVSSQFPRMNRVEGHCEEYRDKVAK